MKAGPPEAPPDEADSRADRPDHPRRPPSMDSLLSDAAAGELLAAFGREAVKEELRRAIADGSTESSEILSRGRQSLSTRFAPSLRRVINGTGVLLHTNLGRAPLSDAARREIEVVAAGYSSLEYDAPSGERGRRQDHVRDLARDVFGCEDALAVNNNASAVFLALSALARGRRVLISRGELVAIGGSFQVPAILEASGARLAEVGTTNRTTIDDYRRGLTPDVALLLTVHPSNYEIRGFTATAPPAEIAALAREAKIPWLHDQGTGSVVDLAEFGVGGEPTVAGCLAEGATLVTFSGDKLLGGPQAGIVAGAAEAMSRLAEHPVARVVRPDKLTFAALHASTRRSRGGSKTIASCSICGRSRPRKTRSWSRPWPRFPPKREKMTSMRRPLFSIALATTLGLTLGAAAACNRKAAGPTPGPAKATPVPSLQYTPMPAPPTPTLRPGMPTRLPSLPG
ncbi:MAG: L-seryl-tRNA(Sec) selenium transferase [Acidobacteria bacterium]|nr:L-seryl-tRNA(Sec) selenium transferase [Acidobacteriota bacterium]